MNGSGKILPAIEKCFFVVRDTKKMALEYSLGNDGNFYWLIFFKVVVSCDNLVIKNSKVCVIIPHEIGSTTRNNSLEGSSLYYTKLAAIAKAKVVTVGTVL